MASPEQPFLPFPEESKEERLPAPESHGPSHIETDDECQYCGAPYESDRSCQYCQSNPTKKAYLRSSKK
ncbi:MAG: hypothetical protein KGJ31_03590 [Patescibacteria group bacterium]|nr:hypothetical protein [Patescibacteria group bacterium]